MARLRLPRESNAYRNICTYSCAYLLFNRNIGSSVGLYGVEEVSPGRCHRLKIKRSIVHRAFLRQNK